MQDKLARIKAIGFTLAGRWKLSSDGIAFELGEFAESQNVLYSFLVDGELAYVGKTIKSLHQRMQSYKTPAKSGKKGGSTNIKYNKKIHESRSQGKTVEVHMLSENGRLQYGGFHVNLAAGLEDSLVRELTPPWSGGKEESPDESLEPTLDESYSPAT